MALHEESVMDACFGDYVNHDLAGYHIAVCADVGRIEAAWIEEDDPHLNPMCERGSLRNRHPRSPPPYPPRCSSTGSGSTR
jgi:hypothetical protein